MYMPFFSLCQGHTIMESAAKSNIKKVSLELGGKSPLIIFADFDLDRAVRIAMGGCFFNKVKPMKGR